MAQALSTVPTLLILLEILALARFYRPYFVRGIRIYRWKFPELGVATHTLDASLVSEWLAPLELPDFLAHDLAEGVVGFRRPMAVQGRFPIPPTRGVVHVNRFSHALEVDVYLNWWVLIILTGPLGVISAQRADSTVALIMAVIAPIVVAVFGWIEARDLGKLHRALHEEGRRRWGGAS